MCRYHSISARLLDIAPLLGCPRMLPLHDVAFDDVKRSGRRGKTCNPLMKTLTPPLQKVVLNDVNYQKMT